MDEQNNKVKTDKLSDKAFLRLVTTSILGIIVCLVCLCSTTYAWFTASIPSVGNELKTAGACDLEVTVSPHNPEGEAFTDIENGVLMEPGVDYLVVMLLPPGSASGYCLIEADGKTYYSDYIIGNSDEPQIKSFWLKIDDMPRVVTFTTRWGILNRESDVVGGTLSIGDVGVLSDVEAPTEPNENISE